MTKKIESLNFVGNIDDDETFLQAETVRSENRYQIFPELDLFLTKTFNII